MNHNNFIVTPNLPEGEVTAAIVGKAYTRAADSLGAMGVSVLFAGEDSPLAAHVKCHADMLCHHLGGRDIVVAQNERQLLRQLSELGFNVRYAESRLSDKYPNDTPLNCARIGDKLICGRAADNTLTRYASENGIETIYVNQGYSRCSSCIVDENALITSDGSIYDACVKNGVDALLISKGHIALDGYDYGFIGGASAKIKKDLLLTFGDISSHPDSEEIVDFCMKYGVSVRPLYGGTLTDIGGIIPLAEKPL